MGNLYLEMQVAQDPLCNCQNPSEKSTQVLKPEGKLWFCKPEEKLSFRKPEEKLSFHTPEEKLSFANRKRNFRFAAAVEKQVAQDPLCNCQNPSEKWTQKF